MRFSPVPPRLKKFWKPYVKLWSRQLCWQCASNDNRHFRITQYCFLLAYASVVVCNVMCNSIESFSRQIWYMWLVLSFAQEAISCLKNKRGCLGMICFLMEFAIKLFIILFYLKSWHSFTCFTLVTLSFGLMDAKFRAVYVPPEVIWSNLLIRPIQQEDPLNNFLRLLPNSIRPQSAAVVSWQFSSISKEGNFTTPPGILFPLQLLSPLWKVFTLQKLSEWEWSCYSPGKHKLHEIPPLPVSFQSFFFLSRFSLQLEFWQMWKTESQ